MANRTHTYLRIPELQKPENNVLLLLTWTEQAHHRPFKVLEEWAQSEDGCHLYQQMAREFQGHQLVAQLALHMAALMNYRRLHPDHLDASNKPITDSYIADLDALLGGTLLGNSGRVAEQMVFALVRTLRSLDGAFEDLTTFLETTLNRDQPPLHAFDGFSDEYVRWRIDGLPQEAAMIMLLELRGKDYHATKPEESSIQMFYVHDPSGYCYRIVEYAALC
jgi:hypothetical protein